MSRYHLANRERLLEQRRQERAANPEKHQAIDRTRWAGERREKGNQMRSSLEQEIRLSRPWEKLLFSAERRAKKKGVPFGLLRSWAEARWTGKCELTGLDFMLGQRGSGPKGLSPSIDRIKPERGYVPENCRFVIWAVNAFKHDGDDELMYRIAEALLKHRLSD